MSSAPTRKHGSGRRPNLLLTGAYMKKARLS